jgi:hypothetical protein
VPDSLDMACCGIKEIADICDTPTATGCLKSIVNMWYTPEDPNHQQAHYNWSTGRTRYTTVPQEEDIHIPAFAIFSDIGKCKYGDALMKLITKLELGEVHRTLPNNNSNSGNDVTVYLWRVDREKLLTLCRDGYGTKPQRKKKVA